MTLVGQSLWRYRILEPIDTGEMAAVCKAYRTALEGYAVKVSPAQHIFVSGFSTRFERKVRLVAGFAHLLMVHSVQSAYRADKGERPWL